MSRAELRGQLEQYYKESDVKYLNWGRDEEREGASFLVQDYQHLGFRGNIFDRVIFAESYIHSDNKQMLLEEAFRVLKPGGVIVIADVFLENDPHDSKEERMLEGEQRSIGL